MGLLMTKNRELFVSIALVVVALLIGAGIGHSFTKAPTPGANSALASAVPAVTKAQPAEQKASLAEKKERRNFQDCGNDK